MTVTEALNLRRATPSYDKSVAISLPELEALINLACLAPSSMNLQPWEFLICTSDEDKARMQSVAMNQKKVSEASAVIAVICNLEFPDNAEAVADSNIANGYFPVERKQGFVGGASTFREKPQALREEAIRSCNLWAMAFMLAATEAGWSTSPMGGFVAEDLTAEFKLPSSRFPVLLITIGKPNPEITILPRNIRFSAKDLSHFGNW